MTQSSTSGNGAYTVRIDKGRGWAQGSAIKIPLQLQLKEDTDTTESGGIVNFAITEITSLKCATLKQTKLPADNTEIGCYHAGSVVEGTNSEQFKLAFNLLEEVTAKAATTSEVKEGNASSTGNEAGEFIITFAEGQFVNQQNLAIKFYKSVKASDGSVTTTDLTLGAAGSGANVTLKPVGTENTDTTNGVSISGSTLTINANTAPPVRAAFSVNLDQANNDGGLTSIFMEVDKPEGLGKVGDGLEEDKTDPNNVKLKGEVDVRDADLNRVTLEHRASFAASSNIGTWTDSSKNAFVTSDRKALYQQFNSANNRHSFALILDRAWTHATPLDVVISVGEGLNISKTRQVTGNNDITLQFTNTGNSGAPQKEAFFVVRSNITQNDNSAGTASIARGFVESVITANPNVVTALADEVADTNATAKFIRMDNDNLFNIKKGTVVVQNVPSVDTSNSDAPTTKTFAVYDAVEGSGTVDLLLDSGGRVEAPAGSNYTVSFGVFPYPDGGPAPSAVALGLANDPADVSALPSAQATTLNTDGTVAFPLGWNDTFVNGDRYVSVLLNAITPANRGAGISASQTTYHTTEATGESYAGQDRAYIRIRDNEKGNIALSTTSAYPSAGAGATAAERATVALNSGSAIGENSSATHDFSIVLNRAHNTNDSKAFIPTGGTSEAPLQVKIAPVNAPADFTHADYEITLASGTASTISLSSKDTSTTAGSYTVGISRASNFKTGSPTTIPLKLKILKDDVIENGGTVNFEITALGHLGCATLVEPASAANAETGCYHAGGVEGAKFKLAANLIDESGSVDVSFTSATAPANDGDPHTITVNEGSAGFSVSFNRQPANGLGNAIAGGYPIDISRLVSIENASGSLTADDFDVIQRAKDGNPANAATLTNAAITNIKGFAGKTSATTGLNLLFKDTGATTDTNILTFKIKDDALIEANETFDLVINKGGTTQTIASTNTNSRDFKFTGEHRLRITIASDDQMTATWTKGSAVSEGGNSATYAAGEYTLNLSGAELAEAATVGVKFIKTITGGSSAGTTNLITGTAVAALANGVVLNKAAGKTSTGVDFAQVSTVGNSHGDATLTLPAGNNNINVVFTIGLGQTTNDGGTTNLKMELAKPTPNADFIDGTGITTSGTNYVGPIEVQDSDQIAYAVKFERSGSAVTSIQEGASGTTTALVMYVEPIGDDARFPTSSQDLDSRAGTTVNLNFVASIADGGDTELAGFTTAAPARSTYNTSTGRYEWTINLPGNNTAEANRYYTATVKTASDVSTLDLTHLNAGGDTYKPITFEAQTGEFTLVDDDNFITFLPAIGSADSGSGSSITPGAVYAVTSGEGAGILTPDDYFAIGTAPDGGEQGQYRIHFTVENPTTGDPMEATDFTVGDGNNQLQQKVNGVIQLTSAGALPDNEPFFRVVPDEIIEANEVVKITLTKIEPANFGLQIPSDTNERSRVLRFNDTTTNGVAILSLNNTAATPANIFTAATDVRPAADKAITDVIEGREVPFYVHLSKTTEREQFFTITGTDISAAEFSYDSGATTNQASTTITIPANTAGTKIGSGSVVFPADTKADASATATFTLDNVTGTKFPVKSTGGTKNSNTINVTTIEEQGKVTIVDQDYEITEGETTVDLTLRRIGALSAASTTLIADIAIAYQGNDPNDPTQAKPVTDYAQDTTTKSITFNQGTNAAATTQTATLTLTLNPVANDGVEGDETIRVRIGSASRTGGTSSVHTIGTLADNIVPITIKDRDTGSTLSLVSGVVDSVGELSVQESQTDAAIFLEATSTKRLNPTQIELDVVPGIQGTDDIHATVGGDYTAPNNKIIVTIPPSPLTSAPARVRVPLGIINDDSVEAPVEAFTVALPAAGLLPDGWQRSSNRHTVTVKINDDDNKVNFPAPPTDSAAQTIVVSEAQDTGDADSTTAGKQINVTLSVDRAPDAAASVTVEVVPATDTRTLRSTLGIGTRAKPLATSSDFTLVGDDDNDNEVVVNFRAPDPNDATDLGQQQANVVLTIQNDDTFETPEFLALRIKDATGFGIGDNNLVIVQINDDDRTELTVTNTDAVFEDGATDDKGNPVGDPVGTITLTLSPGELPAAYRVEIRPDASNRFTFTPRFLSFEAVAYAPGDSTTPISQTKTVSVTARSGATTPDQALFTVVERDSSATTNGSVDIVAGTDVVNRGATNTAEERILNARTFPLNYTDKDLYEPTIVRVQSAEGNASIDASGKRVVLSESLIPVNGALSLTLDAPENDLTGTGDFLAAITSTNPGVPSPGGQVNYAVTITDGSDTARKYRLINNDNSFGGAAGLFHGVAASGDTAFGFWKNSAGNGYYGFGSSGPILIIQMPNQPYWRNNDTIEGDRQFTVILTPTARVRDPNSEWDAAATAVTGASVRASTSWTFVITDDDINTSERQLTTAQMQFQHYSISEVENDGTNDGLANDNFESVNQNGRWINGLPSRIEKGRRLWLRLSSTRAFSEHLNVEAGRARDRISFRADPAGTTPFMETEEPIYIGFKVDPDDATETIDNSKSQPFRVDIPFTEDESGNRVIVADELRGHATLGFQNSNQANKVPLIENPELQSIAVFFNQPQSNSVVQVEPSDAAFKPVFTMTDGKPLAEATGVATGEGSLSVGVASDTALGADSTATITFSTSVGNLRVVPNVETAATKVAVAAINPLSYRVTFKKGATPGAADSAPPTFNLNFVSTAGGTTRADPDSATGTPIVSAVVLAGGRITRYPISVVDNEPPAFGFVARGAEEVFESDIVQLFPQFSVGPTPISAANSNQVKVDLTIEVTEGATAGQGVKGIHDILTAGGWSAGTKVGTRIPYTKQVSLKDLASGTHDVDDILGITLANDTEISPAGSYELVFKAVSVTDGHIKNFVTEAVITNQPAGTAASQDLTFTVYDDDRRYTFLNAADATKAAGNGAWGTALQTSGGGASAAAPILKDTIAGLLESAVPTYGGGWESVTVDGEEKIYGYLEGVEHQVDLYLQGGGVASGTNFGIGDVLPNFLWRSTDSLRVPGLFGSGDDASCDVLSPVASNIKASNAFGADVSDDGAVPSDPLALPIYGTDLTSYLSMSCGGREYQVRHAEGQPRVLYRLNDDPELSYSFVTDGLEIPSSGTNDRFLCAYASGGRWLAGYAVGRGPVL